MSAKALDFVNKQLGVPLPSLRTLNRKFSFMGVESGWVQPAFEYLKNLAPRLKAGENLATLFFDEVRIEQRAAYDKNFDTVIGPHKDVQCAYVRSIKGDWQFPIYQDYDVAMSKDVLFDIIRKLEELPLRTCGSSIQTTYFSTSPLRR